jgi:hypothetical protein
MMHAGLELSFLMSQRDQELPAESVSACPHPRAPRAQLQWTPDFLCYFTCIYMFMIKKSDQSS